MAESIDKLEDLAEVYASALFALASRQSGIDEEEAMRAIFLGVSCQLLQAA